MDDLVDYLWCINSNSDMDPGVVHLAISDIGENIPNALITGIIIAKQNPRKVNIKQGGAETSQERAVWNFTIRDSPCDLINVSCWGTFQYVNELAETFHIGDVVEISKPKIVFRQNGSDERFRPTVTSPFHLTVSENKSSITSHAASGSSGYLPLLKLPTKPAGDFFTLSDVCHNGTSLRGEFVNLLVAVRDVGPLRHITTKDGREIDCRDVMVFDQTNNGMPIQLWNIETVYQAEKWRPRETDMRLDWNTFRRGMVASEGPCTIVTEDPQTPAADTLRAFAQSAPLGPAAIVAQLTKTITDPNTINKVMSVQQVLDRAYTEGSDSSGGDDTQFTALVYALLTQYDLDGCSPITVKKCVQCQLPVQDICMNLECPIGSGAEIPKYDINFDLRVRLTDHTGSLENCRLVGAAAEHIIGFRVEDFLNLPHQKKTELKWKFLLERCAVRILVLRPSPDWVRPLISVLTCEVADPSEVSTHIPFY